jgi:hypothetical protein
MKYVGFGEQSVFLRIQETQPMHRFFRSKSIKDLVEEYRSSDGGEFLSPIAGSPSLGQGFHVQGRNYSSRHAMLFAFFDETPPLTLPGFYSKAIFGVCVFPLNEGLFLYRFLYGRQCE